MKAVFVTFMKTLKRLLMSAPRIRSHMMRARIRSLKNLKKRRSLTVRMPSLIQMKLLSRPYRHQYSVEPCVLIKETTSALIRTFLEGNVVLGVMIKLRTKLRILWTLKKQRAGLTVALLRVPLLAVVLHLLLMIAKVPKVVATALKMFSNLKLTWV